MASPKRVFVAIAIIIGFLILLSGLIMSYHFSSQGIPAPWLAPFVTYHSELMLVMGALGLGVGAAVFYLMSEKVEVMSEKVEAKQAESRITVDMLLSFLSSDERKAVTFIADNNGLALQSELSRLPGMSRLKAHRVVQRLSQKEIISAERHGKINKLRLSPAVFEALKKK